jgi:hypothetical protein
MLVQRNLFQLNAEGRRSDPGPGRRALRAVRAQHTVEQHQQVT